MRATSLIFLVFLQITKAHALVPTQTLDFTRSLNSINQPSTNSCSTETPSCSKTLNEFLLQDDEDLFFGKLKSEYKSCSLLLSARAKATSHLELLHTFKQEFPELAKQHAFATRCSQTHSNRTSDFISKYYYSVNRVQAGQLDLIEQMAVLGKLLNNKDWSNSTQCSSSSLPTVAQYCKTLSQSCTIQPDLTELVTRTEKNLKEIAALEKEKKSLLQFSTSRMKPSKEKSEQTTYKLQVLNARIQNKTSQIPWVMGPLWASSWKTKGYRQAIEIQLMANYEAAKEQYLTLEQSLRCLQNDEKDEEQCQVDKIRRALTLTPHVHPSKVQQPVASSHFEYQACLLERKYDQVQTSTILKRSAIDASLTVATIAMAGIPAIVLKAVERGLMTANMAKNLEIGARLTEAGINYWQLNMGASDAIELCRENTFGAKDSSPNQLNACEKNPIFGSSKTNSKFNQCLDLVLLVMSDGLRFSLNRFQDVRQLKTAQTSTNTIRPDELTVKFNEKQTLLKLHDPNNDKLVAHVDFDFEETNKTIYIGYMETAEEYQKQGVAETLIKIMLQQHPTAEIISTHSLLKSNKDIVQKYLQEGHSLTEAIMQTPSYKIRAKNGFSEIVPGSINSVYGFNVRRPTAH